VADHVPQRAQVGGIAIESPRPRHSMIAGGLLRDLALRVAWLCVFFIAPNHSANAQQPDANRVGASQEEPRSMRDRAGAMKSQAETQYARDQAECYRQNILLTNSCLDSAKERKKDALLKANALAKEGRNRERELNLARQASKEERRAADNLRSEAETRARIDNERKKQAVEDANRTDRLAKEAVETEKRRTKLQAEEIARTRKQQERMRRDAEAERLRPERIKAQAEREREAAEHAAKTVEKAKRNEEARKRRDAEAAAARQRAEAQAAKKRDDDSLLCWIWPARFCGVRNGEK
jgi:hypothetical protein